MIVAVSIKNNIEFIHGTTSKSTKTDFIFLA